MVRNGNRNREIDFSSLSLFHAAQEMKLIAFANQLNGLIKELEE